MALASPSHGRPKAVEQTKNFNLWNDGKDSHSINNLANSQFSEILLPESLKLEVFTGLHDSCHLQAILKHSHLQKCKQKTKVRLTWIL